MEKQKIKVPDRILEMDTLGLGEGRSTMPAALIVQC